jgi:hypothetical protein
MLTAIPYANEARKAKHFFSTMIAINITEFIDLRNADRIFA